MLGNLFDALKRSLSLGSPKALPDPFDTYYDEEAKVFCIGDLPLNIKKEAAGIIKAKLGNDEIFDRASLDDLLLQPEGRALFDEAFSQLCFWISKLIGNNHRKRGQPLYPWKCAVCIVPTLAFNAWVRLSYDEKENTALIFLNIGVLLENLDRLHRIHATPGFLDTFTQESGLAPIVPFQQQEGLLGNLSDNPHLHAIATEVAIKASMLVVFHEWAHFICGHVSYLRTELGHSGEIHEAPEASDEEMDNDLRRMIELDADETAGIVASVFWREFDHPAVALPDMQNEAFSMEVIMAVLSNNLILGQYELNDRYYSPLWRTQHLLERFYADFFYVNKALPQHEQAQQRESNSREMHPFQMKLVAELERAYKILGLGEGLSFERLEKEIEHLLGQDQHELVRLRNDLRKYSPANHYIQRPTGQTQY